MPRRRGRPAPSPDHATPRRPAPSPADATPPASRAVSQLDVFRGLRYESVDEVDGSSEAGESGVMEVSPERSGRHRAGVQRGVAAATDVRPGARLRRRPSRTRRDDGSDAPLFTRAMLDYAAHRPGQPLALLQAGCTTAGGEPDVARLRATGCHVAVSLVDDDSLTARAAVAARPELASCVLGDLRTAPRPPAAPCRN